jgi:copper transport protein
MIRAVHRAAAGSALLLVAVTALVLPARAAAHANLVQTEPRDRAILARAPARVLVRFDDDVRVAPGNAAIRNGGGSVLAARPHASGRTLVLPLRRRLRDGDYSVRWSVVSNDGHVVQGVLAFAVGVGRAAPVPALRPSSGVGPGTIVARWFFFAGLLVASGLALFDVVVWRPLARRGLGTGWIAIGLAAVFISSHGLVHASHGGSATRFGLTIDVASAVAATGAAAAAIGVVDGSAAPFALVPALLLLPVPTLAGHALDPGRSWVEVPIDLLHVLAASVWIGGIVAFAVVVPRAGAPQEVAATAAQRFSRLALAAVALLAATGALRAVAELSQASQLWTTSYGRAILVKTALFALLVGFGAASRSRVASSFERLRATVTVELVLVLGVVAAVAWLTSLSPGRR